MRPPRTPTDLHRSFPAAAARLALAASNAPYAPKNAFIVANKAAIRGSGAGGDGGSGDDGRDRDEDDEGAPKKKCVVSRACPLRARRHAVPRSRPPTATATGGRTVCAPRAPPPRRRVIVSLAVQYGYLWMLMAFYPIYVLPISFLECAGAIALSTGVEAFVLAKTSVAARARGAATSPPTHSAAGAVQFVTLTSRWSMHGRSC